MLKTLLALSLSFLALPALAQDGEALGFTRDGAFFVVFREDGGGPNTPDYVVYDARSGQKEDEKENEVYRGLDAEQYKAWVAQHPLAPVKSGPKSPDGKLRIETTKGGSWKKDVFEVPGVSTWTGDSGEVVTVPPPITVTFSVKAGKKRWPSTDLTFELQNVDHSVDTVWSPDGNRVAYVVHTGGMGVPGEVDVTFGPMQGPRVQVLSAEGAAPEAVAQAYTALETAGLAPTGTGTPKGSHPTSVVFAAKGFEAEARKAAAALPGARVDKLTWKAGYDLVVVVAGK